MRKSAVRLIVLVALAAWGALFPSGLGICSGDPWYKDGDGHWASRYIRLLWEEEVADGEESATKKGVFYYRPDHKVTRGQYVSLLFKVFQLPPHAPETPSYPDVPPTYEMLWRKPAWEFIEGALSGGISFVSPGAYFKPDRYTTREDAVAFLVRSLDLEPYAQSIPRDQVQAILRGFSDWRDITPSRENALACAVSLGILEGYEDGKLKPLRYMSRAEAATVVCRSCLIRVSARLDRFSPDGDGVNDTVGFDVGYLKNRGIREWEATIYSESGKPVYYFNPNRETHSPPLYLSWDGRDSKGIPVPSGLYYYQAWVKDAKGRVFSSVAKPLVVEIHSLNAYLSPARCTDGQPLHIIAATTPKASSVIATFSTGSAKNLSSPDGGLTWSTEMIVGPQLPLGPQLVVVTAGFQGTSRSVTLQFERLQDIWILASVEPNPAAWGQVLDLTCSAAPSIQAVSTSLFGQELHLSMGPGGIWRGEAVVPLGIPAGVYPALFTGTTAGSHVRATVPLEVRDPLSAEIIYVLSK